MKTLKLILKICLIALPVLSFAQNTKKATIEKLNISIELAENWVIQNSRGKKCALVKNNILKSTYKIQYSDYKKTCEKISKDLNYEGLGVDLNKLSSLQLSEEEEVSMGLSVSKTELVKNSEIITIDKILNNKAYLIKATIPEDCSKCKEEFESMVSSMEHI